MELRSLGYAESVIAELHGATPGTLPLVVAAEFDGVVSAPVAEAALSALHARHPLLGARLLQGPEGWAFASGVPFSAIPVSVAAAPGGFDLGTAMEGELTRARPSERHLWRATLVVDPSEDRTILIVAAHHAMTDALALLSLSRQFEHACACIEGQREAGWEPLPLLADVENLLYREDMEPPSAPAERAGPPWNFERPAMPAERTPRLLLREMGPDEVLKLLGASRHDHTTVNATLVAALIEAADSLPNRRDGLTVHVPHSVRGHVAPRLGDEHQAFLVRDVSLDFDGTWRDLDLWERAQRVEAQYLARLPAALRTVPAFTRTQLDTAVGPLLAQDREGFVVPFVVTNLGHQDPPAGVRPLGLRAFRFMPSQRPGLSGIIIAVATIRDRMALTFGFAEPLVRRASASAFADAFMAALRAPLKD